MKLAARLLTSLLSRGGWSVAFMLFGCKSQEAPAPDSAPAAGPPTEAEAAAAYEAREYARCAKLYLALKTPNALYNATCCQALAGGRSRRAATTTSKRS